MRPYDLIAFDVDGTLVAAPDGRIVWQIFNRHFTGSDDQNEKRYRAYLAGELSYPEWVELDVSGWRDAGATRERLIEILTRELRLVDGAHEALATLRDAGCRLFVVSGTLDLVLQTFFPESPFEEVYSNHIGFDEDGRISHWRPTPFDMAGKAKLLRALALRLSIPLARCAFVGDSANDTWIARDAGFSVAFNPNSAELEQAADVVVRDEDLRSILPHLLPPTAADSR